MKALLLSLSLITLTQIVHADEIQSATTWVDTNNVFISNSQNPEIARRDCETTMRILSIMSNDKVVFQTKCESVVHPRCTYYFCYQMSTKVFVLPTAGQIAE